MSVGNNLQEMENVVTKNAAPGEPMQKLTTGGTPATWEDLGGPTPENSKPDDNSNKLATPGKTLKQVRDVVNKKATPGDQATPSGNATPGTLKQGDEPEVKDDQEIVAEVEKFIKGPLNQLRKEVRDWYNSFDPDGPESDDEKAFYLLDALSDADKGIKKALTGVKKLR